LLSSAFLYFAVPNLTWTPIWNTTTKPFMNRDLQQSIPPTQLNCGVWLSGSPIIPWKMVHIPPKLQYLLLFSCACDTQGTPKCMWITWILHKLSVTFLANA
jgi:hypothetical protein